MGCPHTFASDADNVTLVPSFMVMVMLPSIRYRTWVTPDPALATIPPARAPRDTASSASVSAHHSLSLASASAHLSDGVGISISISTT
eukprot:653153-Pyramimonas_sp.AAC.1